jgi:hypothetical protein
MYFVASSDMRATRLRFLAEEDVECDTAMNHAGVPGTCITPGSTNIGKVNFSRRSLQVY